MNMRITLFIFFILFQYIYKYYVSIIFQNTHEMKHRNAKMFQFEAKQKWPRNEINHYTSS